VILDCSPIGNDKAPDPVRLRERAPPVNVRPRRRGGIGHRSPNHARLRLRRKSAHRKRIEEAFDCMKTIGGIQRPMGRGTDRVGWSFVAAAYNLVRLPKLLVETAA